MILIGFAIAALTLLGSGVVYQQIGAQRDQRRFREPGRLVPVRGGCRLHLYETGNGTPAVVLEAGIAATSLSWSHVQPLVSKFTRAASYDRGGLGWSERCNAPLGLTALTEQLAELLLNSGIEPPYILVGHSFGGLLIRAFAHEYPEKVAGLLMVDPVSIQAWAVCSDGDKRRLATGVRLSRRGSWLARLGIVRATLAAASASHKRLTKTVAKLSAGKGTSTLQRLVGEVQKLPPEVVPIVRSHWSRPECFTAMASYLECLPGCAEEAIKMAIPPEIPLTILSAANATTDELHERESLALQSQRGRHYVVQNTGHWLHLERPDLVAASIRELCDEWNASSPD
ncbi:MAG: alpha/beta hydrolase [Acidobacteriota bacterium]|nr:alpha/beta hydrolase [Acidobacteriota bacterium]